MKNVLLIIVVVLFFSGNCDQPTEIVRHAPVIKRINVSRTMVYPNEFVDIDADVYDEDNGEDLTYLWQSTSGRFVNVRNNPTQWQAPGQPDSCIILLTVNDGYFEAAKSTVIVVIAGGNSY